MVCVFHARLNPSSPLLAVMEYTAFGWNDFILGSNPSLERFYTWFQSKWIKLLDPKERKGVVLFPPFEELKKPNLKASTTKSNDSYFKGGYNPIPQRKGEVLGCYTPLIPIH